MNKTELIAAIAESSELSKKDAGKALDAFIDIVTDELKKAGTIQLIGFGTFSTDKRAARKGKNPRTGEEVVIPERNVPKFKAGKGFKDAVNAK